MPTYKELRQIETQQKAIQMAQATQVVDSIMDKMLNKISASKMDQLMQMYDAGLLTEQEIRNLLNELSVDIETRVQAVKIDGRDMLLWEV